MKRVVIKTKEQIFADTYGQPVDELGIKALNGVWTSPVEKIPDNMTDEKAITMLVEKYDEELPVHTSEVELVYIDNPEG